jgi:sodium-dependent dicarboxylate transporter 2/3/5
VPVQKKDFNPYLPLAIVLLTPILTFSFASHYPAVLAVFITAMLLWFTEALPLPVTALLIPVLISLFGVLAPDEAFAPFGDDILFLFLGCFLMGQSMAKYGFDKRVAYWLLSRCLPGESLLAVNIVIAGSSFFLSMWISNTAATAIMSAITVGVLDSLKVKISDEKIMRAVTVRLLLGCAFGASIGGLATPIGSPPNLIALKYLALHHIEIPFLHWMAFALPVSLVMLGLLFVIFERIQPIRRIPLQNIRRDFAEASARLGPFSRGERQIAIVFAITVFLWVLPEMLKLILPDAAWIVTLSSRATMSVVGLLGGITAFFLPVPSENGVRSNLLWDDAQAVEWGTIILFGGGLSLGAMLDQSGAAKSFGELVFSTGVVNLPVMVLTIIIAGILLSEFASNTAAAAILIPLVIASGASLGISTESLKALVLTVAFASSFGFMLPVSTPPNAIVYGTGRVSSTDMMRAGVWFDCVGALVIALFFAGMSFVFGS